jgi:hypothetical protein
MVSARQNAPNGLVWKDLRSEHLVLDADFNIKVNNRFTSR